MGFAYGKGHGKGKPQKPPKPPKTQPPPSFPPPIVNPPPPIDDNMANDCFGSSCPPKSSPKPIRRTNRVRFVTRGVQGIRRY